MAFGELNYILITFILVIILIVIYFIFKKELEPEKDIETDQYSMVYLKNGVIAKISEIAGENIYELRLNKKET